MYATFPKLLQKIIQNLNISLWYQKILRVLLAYTHINFNIFFKINLESLISWVLLIYPNLAFNIFFKISLVTKWSLFSRLISFITFYCFPKIYINLKEFFVNSFNCILKHKKITKKHWMIWFKWFQMVFLCHLTL